MYLYHFQHTLKVKMFILLVQNFHLTFLNLQCWPVNVPQRLVVVLDDIVFPVTLNESVQIPVVATTVEKVWKSNLSWQMSEIDIFIDQLLPSYTYVQGAPNQNPLLFHVIAPLLKLCTVGQTPWKPFFCK